jgi:hypothetical protein
VLPKKVPLSKQKSENEVGVKEAREARDAFDSSEPSGSSEGEDNRLLPTLHNSSTNTPNKNDHYNNNPNNNNSSISNSNNSNSNGTIVNVVKAGRPKSQSVKVDNPMQVRDTTRPMPPRSSTPAVVKHYMAKSNQKS